MKYQVGHFIFPTKKSCVEYTKKLKNNATIGSPILGQGDEFLRQLIARHPRAEEKIGRGVQFFTVGCDGPYRSRHFVIHRMDQTRTDFSYKSCFNPPTHRSRVYAALRFIVKNQILAFLAQAREQEDLICAITERKLLPSEVHVDHYPYTFSEIVDLWLRGNGLKPEDIHLVSPQDNQQAERIENPELIRAFSAFHRDLAHYRILAGDVNVRLGNSLPDINI